MLATGTLVSALTLASRIAGLARDVVVATVFGASPAADAFFVAFRIPNFFRRLFAEGAFSAAFVPVLASYRETRSRGEVAQLVAGVAGLLGGALLLLSGAAVLGAEGVALAFAPGFADDAARLALTQSLMWLTLPYLVFISLTALAAAVLNAYGRFGPPAFAPMLLNLSLIAAALGLAPHLDVPVLALGVGVLAAGVLQLGMQLPYVHALGLLRWPRLAWRDDGVRRVFAAMLPALFGASVAQVNLLVDTWIASFLAPGSVSWLYYAERLLELPVGVLAVGLATVTLPYLSRLFASDDGAAFASTLDWSVRLGALTSIPAALALVVLAGPLMHALFGRGAFTTVDAGMAAAALQAYALGLPGLIAVKLFAPAYYARQDLRSPVRIGVLCVFVNLCVAIASAPVVGHVGLAAATAIAGSLNAWLLYRGLARHGVHLPVGRWRRDAAAICAAAGLMAALVWALQAQVEWETASEIRRVCSLAAICIVGAVAYVLVLLAFGTRLAQLRAPPRI